MECFAALLFRPFDLPGQSPHLILMKWNIHDPTPQPVPLVIDTVSGKMRHEDIWSPVHNSQ
jgi:hypothetical protein